MENDEKTTKKKSWKIHRKKRGYYNHIGIGSTETEQRERKSSAERQ